MTTTATIDRSGADLETVTTDHDHVARLAAERATSLRTWAASMGRGSLAPLAHALHRRAGELELIATVLADDDGRVETTTATPVRSIA